MAGLSVNSRDIKRIRTLLKAIPDKYQAAAMTVLKEEFTTAVTEAKSLAAASQYSGEVVAGIKLIQNKKTMDFVSSSPHAPFAEFGTRDYVDVPSGYERMANKFRAGLYSISNRSGGIDFKERIKNWSKAKGFGKNSRGGGGWYLIYKKIKKQGMGEFKTPHFVPSIIRAKARIDRRLTEILLKSIGK